jgi:hypothetical protein
MIDKYGFKQIGRSILGMDEKSFDNDLMNLIKDNPNPDDEIVHTFAEDHKIEPDKVEEKIYEWATMYVEFITGGKAKDKGFTEEDADKEELAKGIEVESEHTPNEEMAKRIALDHLSEMDDYYTKLAKMEGKE